ncbi:MAG: MFS transporter [Chloroflexi bacterium]|nr:MFS transporter [Chloroflexota bacterium]MBI5702080.1 MFS transporter [Chloroflexota bacterium]
MFAFIVIWLGQIVSVLASGMSQFALTIFMYEKTESATALGLMQVFYITPFLLISPFAGVMVDRYNRKLMMMVSDLGAGLATLGILTVLYFDVWQFWHMYVAAVIFGLGNAFQWPAYSAAISTMIPKEQLGRANGLMSLMEAGPGVIAPILAGALLPVIRLTGILFLDVATFLIAIGTLLAVHVPQPARTQEGAQARGGMLKEAAYGFKYIFARPSLLGLQLIFFVGNLFSGIGFTVFAPMILSRSGNDSLMFGTVQSAGAIASVVGGVIMSAWGGFKRRVHGVLFGWILSGLGMAVIGLAGGLPVWIAGVVLSSLVIPLVNGSNQAIWQSKVAPDLQGRVFSARRLIAWFTNPISPIIGGLLADLWLEPAARLGTGLPAAFSWLVGAGPGAGMGLLIVFCGAASALVGMAGYFVRPVVHAETILPDHDALPKAEPA